MAACPQTRRWGPGERLVFEPYTKEVYEETFKWIADHGIFADSAMGSGNYEQVMAAFHKLHFSSVAASSQERLDFFYRQPEASFKLFIHNVHPEHCQLLIRSHCLQPRKSVPLDDPAKPLH